MQDPSAELVPDSEKGRAGIRRRRLFGRREGLISGGMAVGIVTIAFIGLVGVLALLHDGSPPRIAVDGVYSVDDATRICLETAMKSPDAGGGGPIRVTGSVLRDERRWEARGTARDRRLRLELGPAGALVGSIEASLLDPPRRLEGVLALGDPGASVDLVLRFSGSPVGPVPASGCGALR